MKKWIISIMIITLFIGCSSKKNNSNEEILLNRNEIENILVNSNEISNDFKELIEIGIIKPLYLLEMNDNEKYNIIKNNLFENENIEDYYYSIDTTILLQIDEKTQRYFSVEEYTEFIKLNQDKDFQIINDYIKYHIYFCEIFLKKYIDWRGDPTGKCFSVWFDKDNEEFIRYVYWR